MNAISPRRLAPSLSLPGLPDGEQILWQSAPKAGALTRRVFHLRAVAAYFAVIIAICAVHAAASGVSLHAMAASLLHRVLLAAVPLLLIAVYARAIERTTLYSITSKRVVISFGMALPLKFNIPFAKIESAGLRLYPDGTGDIPLQLLPSERLSYLVMWPHTRPWRSARTEPMLRCVPGAEQASLILAEALAEDVRLKTRVVRLGLAA